MQKYISFMLLLLLGWACQPTLVAEFQDLPVVEGYLFAGEPASIKVARLIPFRNDVSYSAQDVDNLSVAIVDETTDAVYTLAPQGGGVYVDSSLRPVEGHGYRLQLWYNNALVTASTHIAEAPANVHLSATSLSVPSFGGGGMGGGMPGGGMSGIDITWDNPAGDYYLVAVHYTDADSAYIDSGIVRTLPATLTQGTSAQVSPMQFSFTGKHLLQICRVQPEYAAFFQANTPPSSQLIEVHANVEGGFGIFTGVSRMEVEIRVYK